MEPTIELELNIPRSRPLIDPLHRRTPAHHRTDQDLLLLQPETEAQGDGLFLWRSVSLVETDFREDLGC